MREKNDVQITNQLNVAAATHISSSSGEKIPRGKPGKRLRSLFPRSKRSYHESDRGKEIRGLS